MILDTKDRNAASVDPEFGSDGSPIVKSPPRLRGAIEKLSIVISLHFLPSPSAEQKLMDRLVVLQHLLDTAG